jgi:hypothetical protein
MAFEDHEPIKMTEPGIFSVAANLKFSQAGVR